MGRLPVKDKDARWTPHDDPYDGQRLQVDVQRRDDKGRHRVCIRCNGVRFDDTLDVFNAFARRKCRESAISKLCLPEDAHEDIETRLLAGAEAADEATETATKPEIVRMSDVKPEKVEWLWPGRIARGKLTLIAGNPGLGKSFLTTDIVARVTTARSWPDSRQEKRSFGGVVMLSAEDDLSDTIRPRLDAHGADVSRVAVLKSIEGVDGAGKYRRSFDLCRDLDHLQAAIKSVENCVLAIVDPISAYMGKTDSHKNAEVRSVLAPLAELAAELRIAVLAISHLRKGEGQAIYRTMGSLAFVAAARSCWVVTEDTADRRRRLLLPTKNNLAPDVHGLAFRIEPHGINEQPAICWEAGTVTVTADEAMAPRRGPKPDARDDAARWLLAQLAKGPALAKEVMELGSYAGFSKRTLQRAYREMGGEPVRDGFGAPIRWSIPSHATNDANAPSGTVLGVNGHTWHQCKNPEEEEEVKPSSLLNTPYVPSTVCLGPVARMAGDSFEALGNRCPKCDHPETVDVPVHGGKSIRRDCARCGHTLDFPRWSGNGFSEATNYVSYESNGHDDVPF